MKIFFSILLIVLSCFNGYSQKDSLKINSYLKNFQISKPPLYSYLINKDNEFNSNLKKRRIEDIVLLRFFIKDSSELGYKYSTHAMDNYNVILNGYVKYKYLFYKWFKYNDKLNYVIYILDNEDNRNIYLSIFNEKGERLSKLLLSEEILSASFTESLIDTDFTIKRVVYNNKTNNITEIVAETLKFNETNNDFYSVKKEKIEGKHFYYDYKSHSLNDDPLLQKNQ
ncbi:MAG: hypothetical protein AB9846_14050 [Tenuifilaceae bacterium]